MRRVMVKEAVKADSTRLRIPLDSLLMLPAGASYTARSGRAHASVSVKRTGNVGLCQKSDFGPAYHKLGSYQVSI